MIRKFLFGDYLRSSFVNLFLFSRWASFCLLFLLICDFCQEIYNEIIRKVSCKPIFCLQMEVSKALNLFCFLYSKQDFAKRSFVSLGFHSIILLSFCISKLFLWRGLWSEKIEKIKCCTMLCWMFSNVVSHIDGSFSYVESFWEYFPIFFWEITSMFAFCTYRRWIQLVDSIRVIRRDAEAFKLIHANLLIDCVGH